MAGVLGGMEATNDSGGPVGVSIIYFLIHIVCNTTGNYEPETWMCCY